MKNKIKYMIAVMLSCFMLGMVSIPTFANWVQPYYSDSAQTKLSLGFSSGKAICSVMITGKSGTTSINDCTMTLTDDSGTVIASWDNLSSSGSSLSSTKKASGVTKGETYTLSVTATVNRNGSSESVSDSVTRTY